MLFTKNLTIRKPHQHFNRFFETFPSSSIIICSISSLTRLKLRFNMRNIEHELPLESFLVKLKVGCLHGIPLRTSNDFSSLKSHNCIGASISIWSEISLQSNSIPYLTKIFFPPTMFTPLCGVPRCWPCKL